MSSRIDKYKLCWGIVLALVWTAVVLVLIHLNGQLTVEELLRYTPENPALAILVLLALFLLKGVDFLVHSGLLYGVSGVLFPLPLALAVSLAGAVVMLIPAYFAGRRLGAPAVAHIAARHPRIQAVAQLPERSHFVLAVLLRATGLPATVAGVYMGAVGFGFVPYLFGSLLGLLPVLIAFTVMGTGIGDLSSPVFWLGLAIRWTVALLSIFLTTRVVRQEKHEK
ncbi:MAG: VTT domain-containing protein [Oscillospiraceae bacterium]|nr:VTT domain-containing protein [Oscillospiraceae bacterium]